MQKYKELSIRAIKSITLLSIEEYRAAQEHIPPLDDWWWLRSPGGIFSIITACICPGGGANDIGYRAFNVFVAVRPALKLNPQFVNLQISDQFHFGGKTWTYIAEGLALSDEAFCKMPFRKDRKAKDANVYETSDVKAYLDRWLKDHTEDQTGKAASDESRVNTQKELSIRAVKNIMLLSIEEYRAAREHIPLLNDWWWLRTSGLHSSRVACVVPGGGVNDVGNYVDYNSVAVRPALKLDSQSVNFQIGDQFHFGGKTWTYIAEGLALSDKAFCKMPFCRDWKAKDANVYEASDVKAYLDAWLAGESSKRRKVFIMPLRTLEMFTIARMLKNAGYRQGVDLFITNSEGQSKWDDLETEIRANILNPGLAETQPDVYGIELAPGSQYYTPITDTSYKILGIDCPSTISQVARLIGHTLTPMEKLISVRAKAGNAAMVQYAEDNGMDPRACDAIRTMEMFIDRGQLEFVAKNIVDITLLTIKEYEAARKQGNIKNIDDNWWLQDPSPFLSLSTAYVTPSGNVISHGIAINDPRLAVRPALRFKPGTVGIYQGNSFSFGGHRWTVITDNTALCDDAITHMPFCKNIKQFDRNCTYGESDVKKYIKEYLNGWLTAQLFRDNLLI